MDSSSDDDGAPGAPGGSGTDTAARPKGRPGRKPKGSVPAVVTEMPDRPDPDHVLRRQVSTCLDRLVRTRSSSCSFGFLLGRPFGRETERPAGQEAEGQRAGGSH